MKRVLLINPPSGLYRRDQRCQNRIEDQTAQVVLPPMDLMMMAAMLERQGIECRIRDFPAEKADWNAFHEAITNPYDALIVSITAPTIETDLLAINQFKEQHPESLTIAVGSYFMLYDRVTLEQVENLDIAVRGEPDLIMSDLLGERNMSVIPGICYRQDETLHRTDYTHPTANLDLYPFPARHLIDNHHYLSPDTLRPITVVQVSRGCPHHCVFCPASIVSGSKVRLRSPESVLSELMECVHLYRIQEFLFGADTFTINRDWVLKLCGLILENRLPIRWAANSRVDTLDPKMLEMMRRAGCHILGFGVESGDEEMLKHMRKHQSLDQVKIAVKMCQESGISAHTFYVLGLPWETHESIRRTLDFAGELDADFFDFNLAFPLPGTEYFEIAQRDKLVEMPLGDSGYANSPVHGYYLSQQQLKRARQKALLRLYLRPHYIARTLWRQRREPRVLLNYLRYGWKRFRQLLRG